MNSSRARKAAKIIAIWHATLLGLVYLASFVMFMMSCFGSQAFSDWEHLARAKLAFIGVCCLFYFHPNVGVKVGIDKEESGEFESWLVMTVLIISVSIKIKYSFECSVNYLIQ